MTSERYEQPGQEAKLETTQFVTVKAKHCLWFAWAEDTAVGPHGETMAECRPAGIPIDDNENQVTIKVVDPTVLWRHGGGDQEVTSAAGRTDIGVRGTKAPYRSAEFNSEYIYAMPMRLNLLVAMVGLTTAPTYTDPVVQEPIGLGPVTLDLIPGKDRFLFLGMHDGYQWNNNSVESADPLELQVELTWLSRVAS